MVKVETFNREDFHAQLSVKISVHQHTASTAQQVLSVEITDETNPYFVYNYQCSESEFHLLKEEERLTLDFQ